MREVIFRDLSGMAEFRAAETLQRSVWGAGDQPDPADLMMVVQGLGGLVGGAFVGDVLMGYIFGLPSRDPQVQHSHRLAVLPEARGLGLGVKLKFYQRDWCLARGISTVQWTYDPLRPINATLNIHRLGAQSGRYLVDYYGEMEGINRGIASDRLLVDWVLDSPLVAARALGDVDLSVEGELLPLALPQDLDALLAQDMAAASGLRMQLRLALQQRMACGQRIVGFDKQSRCYRLA
ncbi:MAG: GNAT family N-acetyltransferase [Cypionkella sp.]|uniref:GNAT family N-acetyltransferase n=1 Tax=Cypionkella sp. TaxID=2811411 RepID=UPI002ABAFDC5|nr:GNAT family N-acetyltransferase [Cypionkella sp.]MDZ4310545.1 GNAT family N-acetyltransferase [Cypionkella sp.]